MFIILLLCFLVGDAIDVMKKLKKGMNRTSIEPLP